MAYLVDEKLFYYQAKDYFEELPFKIFRMNNKAFDQQYHFHDYIQIWYVKQGECIHYFNEFSHKLTKGNVFILPPNIAHKIKVEDGKNIDLIGCEFLDSFINEAIKGEQGNSLFDFAYIEPFMVSEDNIKPTFHLDGAASKNIEDILEETLFEYQQKEKYYALHIKANLLKMLAIIAREYNKGIDVEHQKLIDKYKKAMGESINYMTNNYKNKIYLDDVCKIAMMSPTYFSYVFKQITGRTFTEYLNFVRILRSKELLINSTKTVCNISYEVGFNDPAYFDRVFKKEIGMSPGKFRKFSN